MPRDRQVKILAVTAIASPAVYASVFGGGHPPSSDRVRAMTLLLVVSLLGILYVMRRSRALWKHQERAQQGRCRDCGYDLCATPRQCPECDAAPDG